jgi:hypothetical protein
MNCGWQAWVQSLLTSTLPSCRTMWVVLDPFPFLWGVELWHTSLTYHPRWQGFMTYSMCHNWNSVWRHLWMWYCLKWHHSRQTWPTPSIQSKSSIKRIMSQGARWWSSIRFNEVIIWKKKQHGRARTSSVRAIQTSCYHSEGMCDSSLSLLEHFSFQISSRDFFLGGRLWDP